MQYEGFAGYCAIITPEITEVSNQMLNNLKINKQFNNDSNSAPPQTRKKPTKINQQNITKHTFAYTAQIHKNNFLNQ